jgi:hypothetical protein
MITRMTAQTTFRVSAAFAILSLAMLLGCKHSAPPNAGLKATAQGTALVESSGGHQVGATGTALKTRLVVQVNDDQGTAVPGAWSSFTAPRASALIRPRSSPTPAVRRPQRLLWAPLRDDTISRHDSRQGQVRVA